MDGPIEAMKGMHAEGHSVEAIGARFGVRKVNGVYWRPGVVIPHFHLWSHERRVALRKLPGWMPNWIRYRIASTHADRVHGSLDHGGI